ncbi:XdhC family protein [Coralloluteibacterium stylophorae]|uniref:XdhC family protein n=1 Tax=Coralloluteibacterium stylophorae TaxID=1776034 RepID=A0A8J7VSZ2_9GAMM|nr:XdhC family protein [Coralloluteibacterium stylophorae]MBS7455584.1 XdhC family protein [Coralloluteibacterium stylophorae]
MPPEEALQAPTVALPRATAEVPAAWPQWPVGALVDDVRPHLFDALRDGESCAVATLVHASGPTPRPVGAQMLIRADGRSFGAVSGGCVEAAVAALARPTLESGAAQRLVFGRGSPFVDIQLACGSRIEVDLRRVGPEDADMRLLSDATRTRRPAIWGVADDGVSRFCLVDPAVSVLDAGAGADEDESRGDAAGVGWCVPFVPATRLVLVGGDAVALALAGLARSSGYEVLLIRPNGPEAPPPDLDIGYARDTADSALSRHPPDAWTAVVVCTHDLSLDEPVLVDALRSDAFYVGALGSRSRRDERVARLEAAGVEAHDIVRLHAPVGLPIGAATPMEIALSILADVVRVSRERAG